MSIPFNNIQRTLNNLNSPNADWYELRSQIQDYNTETRRKLLKYSWQSKERFALHAVQMPHVNAVDWGTSSLVQKCALFLSTPFPDFALCQDTSQSHLDAVHFAWAQVSAGCKRSLWFNWATNNSLSSERPEVSAWLMARIKDWGTESSYSGSLKIQALIASLDEWSFEAFSSMVTPRAHGFLHSSHQELYLNIRDILKETIVQMHARWEPTQESIQTWRQLQSYPEFYSILGHPHPWAETLVTIHNKIVISSLPPGLIFHTHENGRVQLEKVPRSTMSETSNVQDAHLAEAFRMHFLKEKFEPHPDIQIFFSLIVDIPDTSSLLLHLSTPLETTNTRTIVNFNFDELC